MIQCAQCGAWNKPTDKYCMNCGARVGPDGPGEGAPGGGPHMGQGASKYGPPQGPSTGQGGYAGQGGAYPPPMPGGGGGGGGYPPAGGPGYPPPSPGGFGGGGGGGGGQGGYGQPPAPYGQGYTPAQQQQNFQQGPPQGGFGGPPPGNFGGGPPPMGPGGGFGPPDAGPPPYNPPGGGFGPPGGGGGFGPGPGGPGGGFGPGQNYGGGGGHGQGPSMYGPPPADPLAATDFANARPNAGPGGNPYGGAPANGGFAEAGGAPGGRRELAGFLISYQADPLGSFWPLYSGRNVVGRAGAADGLDISIADPTTSSNHAAFYIDAQSRATHVEDLGSTNGTFVNEDAIGPRGRRELRDGDRVRLGGFSLVIKVVPRL